MLSVDVNITLSLNVSTKKKKKKLLMLQASLCWLEKNACVVNVWSHVQQWPSDFQLPPSRLLRSLLCFLECQLQRRRHWGDYQVRAQGGACPDVCWRQVDQHVVGELQNRSFTSMQCQCMHVTCLTHDARPVIVQQLLGWSTSRTNKSCVDAVVVLDAVACCGSNDLRLDELTLCNNIDAHARTIDRVPWHPCQCSVFTRWCVSVHSMATTP
jgi:hypothetical protein